MEMQRKSIVLRRPLETIRALIHADTCLQNDVIFSGIIAHIQGVWRGIFRSNSVLVDRFYQLLT